MRIYGIGIDIVEINRVEGLIEKYPSSLDKYFTICEVDYFKKKKNPSESIAGYFAAKEAVSKALGTGFRNFRLRDIEVLKDKVNKPSVALHNKCKEYAEDKGIKHIFLSISHSQNYAVANAVAVEEE